jgi:hypothetical protein
VTTNLTRDQWPLAGPQERQKLLLSEAEQAEALAALRAVARGQESQSPTGPAPGPSGLRWSDVPEAAASACNEEGVELVIVRVIRSPGEFRFVLRSIEDWPGELVVRRVEGPEVYEVVDCRVGRFPDQPQKVARRDKLVEAFRRKMVELGRTRWFNDQEP